ncbi:exodeoxyribonuclease III [Crassaminicella profunda]|uniref:exodeoxyribonuclease III n=1 Tax=Crassaminicella profunda TaxID=1286698 RepID=UPI001CA72EDB|nr:exodeoxyribonuclease III [Crassaminicella profunda]QZY53763.1 exodeoxyribonuclease III [Crassaminicella profunda]
MKIYSWNVNGIRAIKKKGFLEWMEEENPDILCIQETKAHKEQLDESLLNIEGYEAFFCSGERKGYSGVAVYTKLEPITVKTGIGIERFDSEGRILILEYEEFTLLNIYFPNGQKDDERLKYKLEFYDAILAYCDGLKEMGKKLVICGDYNTAHKEIDLKNPKTNEKRSGFLPIERAWIDKFISHGYIDTFRTLYLEEVKYSWWSYRFNARKNNAGWRIDYHFVSDNLFEKVKDAKILNEVMGSDHCPVTLELDL